MQLFNKKAFKKTLYHTWYIYPIVVAISTILLIWGFQAYHQPSAHQRLVLFFATEIRSRSFADKIMEKYDKEELREVEPNYALPSATGYQTKLNLYVNEADILVLDETSMNGIGDYCNLFLIEINQEIKNTYLNGISTYYSNKDKDYGVLLKKKGEDHYLKTYMDFEEDKDYYLAFTVASTNLGKYSDDNSDHYNNALTFSQYLLEGNL